MKHRFHVMQVKDRYFAYTRDRIDIRCAPGMFHNPKLIAIFADGLKNRGTESAQPVYQRRYAGHRPARIPEITLHRSFAVSGKADDALSPNQSRWQ